MASHYNYKSQQNRKVYLLRGKPLKINLLEQMISFTYLPLM